MTTDSILAPVAALTLPDADAMTNRARNALDFIRSFEIQSAEDYGLAADELMAIKGRAKTLEEQRTGITRPLNEVLRRINALFGGPAALLDEAERTIKGKMLTWDLEQRRLAEAERKRAEELAAVERQRLAAEAAALQRQADTANAAAAAARAAGDAQAAELARAEAERSQAHAAIVATTSQLVTAAPDQVAAPTKVKGIATATKLGFEVTDLHALVRHVAAHPELLALVCADEVKLRAYVRGLGMACALPGVRVTEEQTMRARAA
jgi:hypothetical protein